MQVHGLDKLVSSVRPYMFPKGLSFSQDQGLSGIP